MLQPAVGQAAAVAVVVVLVGHVRGRGMRVPSAGVGVSQRSAIGRAARKRTFVLGMSSSMHAVNGVNMRESRGVLLVSQMSVAKF